MKKYVYSFGGGTADGDGKMRDVLGGKGAGLAEMSKAGVPVPPGFTISTEVCNLFFENGNKVPKEVDEQIHQALAKLEKQMGKKLGGVRRSAAGERPLRREVLHARHDEHHPEPRAERQDDGGSGEERPAIRVSLTIAIAASFRCSAKWRCTSTWRSSITSSTRAKPKSKRSSIPI